MNWILDVEDEKFCTYFNFRFLFLFSKSLQISHYCYRLEIFSGYCYQCKLSKILDEHLCIFFQSQTATSGSSYFIVIVLMSEYFVLIKDRSTEQSLNHKESRLLKMVVPKRNLTNTKVEPLHKSVWFLELIHSVFSDQICQYNALLRQQTSLASAIFLQEKQICHLQLIRFFWDFKLNLFLDLQ